MVSPQLSPASRASTVLRNENLGLAPQALCLRPLRGLGIITCRIDHRGDEVFQGGGGVAAAAGVDGRGLDHCAARSDEPMKALALW